MAHILLSQCVMSRFLLHLVALSLLPGVCLASAPALTIPDGPIASALALVDGNKAPEAMKALSSLRPAFAQLGPFHYVYGRALAASGDSLEAALHYRRASVYSGDASFQEKALLMAAEAEFRMGYRFEAKTDCLIFLKRFPQSPREGEVRTLLGRSLSGIGRHHDAVRQFDLAGGSAEALFGKANALQRMGMTIEAARAYSAAMAVDPKFPDFSEETRCWMGENLRVSGLVPRAKELLLKVTGAEYKDYAVFGLGEIAVEESQPDEAIRLFASLASSKDRKLSRNAMLRASDVEAAAGKTREAVARLEAIVDKYPFTGEYDQAVLRLARIRRAAGDPAGALSLFSRLVLRPSTVRGKALDGIEELLLQAREKGPAQLAALWNAGGRWLMDSSREPTLVRIAEDLAGTGKPHRDLVQWLARYGSSAVRSKYLSLRASDFARAGDTAGLRESLRALKGLNAPGDDVARAEAYLKFAEKDYRGAAKALLSLNKLEGGDLSMLGEVLPYADDARKAAAAIEAEAARPGAAVPAGALARLADAQYDAGRRDEAIRLYRLAAERDPEHEWSCYRLAVLLGRDGGEEYRNRIRKDPTLVRMANAAWKELSIDGR